MMQPGRELDALVAEKVMGWTVVRFHPHQDLRSRDEGFGTALERWTSPSGKEVSTPPPYSTSIADAWTVFCRFTSRYLWYDDATDIWHCALDPKRRNMEDCRYHETSEDETGAEAICLAALKAVGVEETGQSTKP